MKRIIYNTNYECSKQSTTKYVVILDFPLSLTLPIVDRKMFVFRASEAHIRSVAASNDNNDVHHSHLKFLHTLQSCVQTNIWWWPEFSIF